MGLDPSFDCLFRRSRYSRSEDDHPSGPRQNRCELFAVAAVAFAIKHDKDFCRHFLSRICGETEYFDYSDLLIEVQPHDHSDLAIKVKATKTIYIVEFKIGADLAEKQNPDEVAFFDKGGYGKLILSKDVFEGFHKRIYVVLAQSENFEDGKRQGLECKSRTWADLEPGPLTELWTDLRDSLGEIGVTVFRDQQLQNMHNAKHTKSAVLMHQTLEKAASQLGLRKTGPSFGTEDDRHYWYGRDIPTGKLVGFSKLEDLIRPKDGTGWFGYESGPDRSQLAIWFYCGSEEAAKETKTFVEARAGPHLSKAEVKEGTNAVFELAGSTGLGDAEWFADVFNALKDTPGPARK